MNILYGVIQLKIINLNLDLKLIKQKEIFTKNHLIIIHREKKTDDDFGKNFQPSFDSNALHSNQ